MCSVGTVSGLTLRAAYRATGGGTSLVFAFGGPPPSAPGSYFRTIANLVLATKRSTSTFSVATVANGTTGLAPSTASHSRQAPEPPPAERDPA